MMQKINERIHFSTSYGFPFVVYSKPDSSKVIGIFQGNKKNFTVSSQKNGFVFAPFDSGKKMLIPEHCSKIVVTDFESTLKPNKTDLKLLFSQSDKEYFESIVQKGIEAINNGVFGKVVLSRREIIETEIPTPQTIFERLKVNYPNAFCYVFYHKTGMWAGATPERLLKKNKNIVETVSLAGTSLYTGKEDVNWSEKDIKEQQIVTDYIKGNLKKHVTDWKISKTYTHRAGNLLHLKTDLKAKLKLGSSLDKIVKALHPTPAVCGDDKTKAIEFILENENYSREYYTGYVGEWQKDFETGEEQTADLFVNLRSMKISEKSFQVFAGCGITKDSIPENEFMETVNKTQTMKKIFFN